MSLVFFHGIVGIVFLFDLGNLCLIGSKLPKEVLHAFVSHEVGSAHHGHGHQKTERQESEAPLKKKRFGEADGGRRGGGRFRPNSFFVEHRHEDEAKSNKPETGEQRGELHSKSSSRIWRRVSMIPKRTTNPTLAR